LQADGQGLLLSGWIDHGYRQSLPVFFPGSHYIQWFALPAYFYRQSAKFISIKLEHQAGRIKNSLSLRSFNRPDNIDRLSIISHIDKIRLAVIFMQAGCYTQSIF